MFKLDCDLKKDSFLFLLHKCITDFELVRYDIRAAALAALNYSCRERRLATNMSVSGMGDGARDFHKALRRIC